MAKLRLALFLMIVIVAVARYWKDTSKHVSAFPRAMAVSASPVDGRLEPLRAPAADRSLDERNQQVVATCLARSSEMPRVNMSSHVTLENVLDDLGAHTDSSTMNVHVRRTDGREERIHIEPHDPTARNAYVLAGEDVRVYDVDREGLPVSKPYPRVLKQDSLKHIIDSFIGDDRVSFKERRAHHVFGAGSASSVETNGRMTELQLNFGRSTLGCAWQNDALTCACL